jgi:dihydrofolate synthase / folylpolyglutamate synthase
MKISPIKTKIFKEGEDIISFIINHTPHLEEKTILVITSKIVALSENRTAIIKDAKTKEEFIRKESEFAISTKFCWLTIKDGMIMASAGIDESNANGKLILLPEDSFESAKRFRKILRRKYKIKKLGIIITDSRTTPLRAGIMGAAIGYAGFKGLRDYRGKSDIFGRKLYISRTDVADSLAAAAVLTMGEANERQPLAIIESAPVKFCELVSKKELYIDPREDMYRPLLKKL